MGQKRLPIGHAAFLKGLLYYWIRYVFGRSGWNRSFDQNHAFGPDLFADDLQAVFERCDVRLPAFHVAEGFLVIITLNIHYNAVGKGKDIIGKSSNQCLFLYDAALDQRRDLGIFRFDGCNALVDVGDLPVRTRRRPLHSYDKLSWFSRSGVDGVCDDARHDGAHKSQAHHNNDLTSQRPLFVYDFLQALEFRNIFTFPREGKQFTVRRL